MKRDYALAIEHEAARLFGVPPDRLFCGKGGDEVHAAQDAVAYALWVVRAPTNHAGKAFGSFDWAQALRRCAARRGADITYDARVGDLVWYAMHGFYNEARAA